MMVDSNYSLTSGLEHDNFHRKTTLAIDPIYSMTQVNEPVTLYRGPITIEFGQGIKIANATLTLEWRRDPVILCSYSPTEEQCMKGSVTEVYGKHHRINFDNLGVSTWAAHFESRSCGVNHKVALKVVSPIVVGCLVPSKKVRIHLVNCHDRSEEELQRADGSSFGSGRLSLVCSEWEILIDKVPKHDDLERHLNKYGGQAITHVMQVSRRDGAVFEIDAANQVLLQVREFLSFATGSKPRLCLASGYLDEESPAWQQWESCGPSQWIRLSNWSVQPYFGGQVGRAFPGYFEKKRDGDWGEAISLSIDWYVQAKSRGLETALVLGQAALELLANTAFENASERPCDEGEWNDMRASDRIRFLLEASGIDPALPPRLTKLSSFRFPDGKPFEDGPHVITAIRNAIAHPKKKKRNQFGDQVGELSEEAAEAVVFFLEHALLVIIGFDGVANAEATHDSLINYGPLRTHRA